MPLSKNPVPENVNPVKTLDVSMEDILKDKSSNVNEVIRAVTKILHLQKYFARTKKHIHVTSQNQLTKRMK